MEVVEFYVEPMSSLPIHPKGDPAWAWKRWRNSWRITSRTSWIWRSHRWPSWTL